MEGGAERANEGLPLEVAIALRSIRRLTSWEIPADDDPRLGRIKQLYIDRKLPEDERIALSRRVLRKYAHDTFAAENAELGWEGFVPPVGDGDTPGLDALDELWTPKASEAELLLLQRALSAAVEEGAPG